MHAKTCAQKSNVKLFFFSFSEQIFTVRAFIRGTTITFIKKIKNNPQLPVIS